MITQLLELYIMSIERGILFRELQKNLIYVIDLTNL